MSKEEDAEITEIRLMAIESMLSYIYLILCSQSEPHISEHMKKTTIVGGGSIDMSRLSGPRSIEKIQNQESLLKLHIASMLSRVEIDEQSVRQQRGLPQVRSIAAELLKDMRQNPE